MKSRSSSKPTVLVVDDEPILRMVAVDFIEDAGFKAVEAESADQALAILETQPEIKIILTDINMPGSMDGLRFAKTVRKRWPPLGIIVVSGFSQHTDLQLPERAVFVPKPYNINAIIDCLHQTMEG